jgi:CheY-like chemotaxis protein
MTSIRILHVDDEPDMRDVVEISLALDPIFVSRSCGSGQEALAIAADWSPDLILLDVTMPVMDGPTTLARLRGDPKIAGIPVIFMTTRARIRELERFGSLGAIGVISKPFDPMTLASSVRDYVQPVGDPLEDLRAGFLLRVKADFTTLATLRIALRGTIDLAATLAVIQQIAHGLAGAGGIFGFAEISDAAAELEHAVLTELASPGAGEAIDNALELLISNAANSGVPPTETLRFRQVF